MTRHLTTKKKNAAYIAAVLCTGAVLSLAGIGAQAAVFNPPIHVTHGIEYMSGGIGSDEAELMRVVEPRWPAVFEFAVKDGKSADFAADVVLTVRDAQGNVVLDQIHSAGPYLLARLEPGRYTVEAVLAGQKIQREVSIKGPGTSSKSVFEWPQGTDTARTASTNS
ncbi:MAG: hypothetical protein JSS56_13685 [Proteobacteria bacterium]|nr:hypothetical protein [Pseudomonadota bacterium]